MNTAPCDRLMTPSTPKISVKPSANSAYTQPSDKAFTNCCSSTARLPSGCHDRRGAGQPPVPRTGRRLLLDDELAVLGDADDRRLLRVVAGRLARLVGRTAELEGAGRAGPLHVRQRVAQRAAVGGEVAGE